MKTQLRLHALSLLAVLCGMTVALPARADITTLYDNGPVNGFLGKWDISALGFVVGNTFNLASPRCFAASCTVTGFSFAVWEFPGDTVSSVQWSITGAFNGGPVYGSGTASGATLTDSFLFSNGSFNIDRITVSGLAISLASDLTGGGADQYWLNLQNAETPSGDPVYWDQNNGTGCGGTDGLGTNCPSSDNATYGAPPGSEDPDIYGFANGTTPEPGSLTLFGSGILVLGGMLRRRLLR